jgi:uncharacterized protein (TIGR02996 family)
MVRPEVMAFLDDIKANIDDDTPRLILADWLSEHDDPRGDFIRCQCQREALPNYHPLRETLRQRELALERQCEDQWLGPLRPHLHIRSPGQNQDWVFVRGMLHLHIIGKLLKPETSRVLWDNDESAWIEHVHLAAHEERGEPLQANDWLALQAVPSLVLRYLNLEDIQSLAKCRIPLAANRLDLAGCHLTDEFLQPLTRSATFPRLTFLNLDGNLLTRTSVAALDAATGMPALSAVRLACNALASDGTRILAASRLVRQLEQLDLSRNFVDTAGVRALASSGQLQRIRELDLRCNDVNDDAIDALVRAPWLGQLTHLILANNQITARGARMLARTPNLDRLQWLDVSGNELGGGALAINDRFHGVALF